MTSPKTTTVPLLDDRNTTFVVQTIPVSTGVCVHGHGSCRQPGAVAVRKTIAQQCPDETSTLRVTLCAEHQAAAVRMHAAWVADARQLQDPVKHREFLASNGITE